MRKGKFIGEDKKQTNHRTQNTEQEKLETHNSVSKGIDSAVCIEVIPFHLRGRCMLGVFLLTAFTCLGHECQDLLSLCDGMHVCTDYTSVYTKYIFQA